jgi:hypothetical protein
VPIVLAATRIEGSVGETEPSKRAICYGFMDNLYKNGPIKADPVVDGIAHRKRLAIWGEIRAGGLNFYVCICLRSNGTGAFTLIASSIALGSGVYGIRQVQVRQKWTRGAQKGVSTYFDLGNEPIGSQKSIAKRLAFHHNREVVLCNL